MSTFLPKSVSLYLAKMHLTRTFAFLIGLVLVLQTLDLLQESDDILAAAGNGGADLWRYVMLRAPQLLSQFLPFSVLLGTLLTLSTLAQNSEITILKSTGMSAHRILLPLIVASGIIAVGHFLFNELLVTRTTQALSAWQAVEYNGEGGQGDMRRGLWMVDGKDLIRADDIRAVPGGIDLIGVRIETRGATGELVSRLVAERAEHRERRWTLIGIRLTDIVTGETRRIERQDWLTEIPPQRFLAVAVEPDQVPYWELGQAIRELKRTGHPTDTLEAGHQHKLSGPLSSILMPLLGAVAGFGLVRSGKLFVRVVVGMALGFSYFVADNFMLAMGQFGAAPPFMSAWAPFILFVLIGETVLFRTEE